MSGGGWWRFTLISPLRAGARAHNGVNQSICHHPPPVTRIGQAREWRDAEDLARRGAKKAVRAMDRRARERVAANLRRQTEAARLRLQRELGRYLVCLDAGSADLNTVLYRQMSRDIASAARLNKALERLGGYPQWSAEIRRELLEFYETLTKNRRRARLLGSEIDAALADPRWLAAK